MKIRTMLVGLGLLVFIFCSANFTRAALRLEPNPIDDIDFMSLPGEHPWQHDTSPECGDDSDNILVQVVILPISPTIKTFQLIRIPPGNEGSCENSANISIFQRNK